MLVSVWTRRALLVPLERFLDMGLRLVLLAQRVLIRIMDTRRLASRAVLDRLRRELEILSAPPALLVLSLPILVRPVAVLARMGTARDVPAALGATLAPLVLSVTALDARL